MTGALTKHRVTRPLGVRLDVDLVARLDQAAARACVTRSALVAAILAGNLPDLDPNGRPA